MKTINDIKEQKDRLLHELSQLRPCPSVCVTDLPKKTQSQIKSCQKKIRRLDSVIRYLETEPSEEQIRENYRIVKRALDHQKERERAYHLEYEEPYALALISNLRKKIDYANLRKQLEICTFLVK